MCSSMLYPSENTKRLLHVLIERLRGLFGVVFLQYTGRELNRVATLRPKVHLILILSLKVALEMQIGKN